MIFSEATITTIFFADVWDGTVVHQTLRIATASSEADAVRRAKVWAKSLNSVPENAWLRVDIDGAIRTIRTFRFGEF
jgi:hypothetical protein